MPFVNINLAGSKTTTKTNWLGYVRTGYFGEPDLPAILKAHGGAVLMYGRLIREHPDFNIYLLLPKSLDPYESSVTFVDDDVVDKIAAKIPHDSIEGSVLVTLNEVVRPKGETYTVSYGDIVVGDLSFKKAKELKE